MQFTRVVTIVLVASTLAVAAPADASVDSRRHAPRVCLDALTTAEGVMSYASQQFHAMGAGTQALLDNDLAGLNAATAQVNVLNQRLAAARRLYDALADECRAWKTKR